MGQGAGFQLFGIVQPSTFAHTEGNTAPSANYMNPPNAQPNSAEQLEKQFFPNQQIEFQQLEQSFKSKIPQDKVQRTLFNNDSISDRERDEQENDEEENRDVLKSMNSGSS